MKCFGCKGYKEEIGVILAQVGTPEAPTPQAVRPYLREFLGDPRVIEYNRPLWWLILNGIILRTRPKRSARLYSRIWTEKGSPLKVITEAQTRELQERMLKRYPGMRVVYGMRYGKPSLESAVDNLIEAGCTKILLFPLYPQYSATTSASAYDSVLKHILRRRWVPTLRIAEPYYDSAFYVDAVAATINEAYESFSIQPEKLVLSYHGIPERYIKKGDPYCCQCTETTVALTSKLNIPSNDVIHTYQSRFGKEPWLVPYTDVTIEELARDGVKRIAVACPGFVADCLETLDELGNEAREAFKKLGGEELHLIPCLNAHPLWLNGLEALVTRELGSWLEVNEHCKGSATFECPVEVEKQIVASMG